MKKLVAILLALCMVLSMAACGSSNSGETEVPTTAAAEGSKTTEAVSAEGGITQITGITDLLVGYNMMAGEERGEKATLIAYTEDGTAEGVTWTSSDESVVTVSADGVVWAKGVGEAVVTAENDQGSMSVDVTVNENMTLEEVVDGYFSALLELGDVEGMTAEELVEAGNEYFYIPHSVEGTDEEIIEAAKNRTFTEQIAFYCKAEAYYLAALEADENCDEASAKLEELYAYRDLIRRLDPDGQGICFNWFSGRKELSKEQMNAFAYDDVFFFAEPQYRGMDTLIEMVGNTETVEGINERIYHVVTRTEDKLYVKLVNVSAYEEEITLNLANIPDGTATYTRLTGEKIAVNTFQNKDRVAPVTGEAVLENGSLTMVLPEYSVTILTFAAK